jgi:hypothetical protein
VTLSVICGDWGVWIMVVLGTERKGEMMERDEKEKNKVEKRNWPIEG